MRIIVGAILVLTGAGSLAYVASGGAAFEREPPFVALGILLVAIGVGVWGRSRAASLVARAGLGATLLGIGGGVVAGYSTSGSSRTDEGLVMHFYLLGLAITAAAIALLFLLVRRAPRASRFGAIDLVPLAGLAASLTLGAIWFFGDDARLRPCRLGNDLACEKIVTQLLESAERAATALPTLWEERAARALDERRCRRPEPGPCGARSYAVGTVALRAGRLEAAKQAFLRACDFDPGWCARAAQEKSLPWTPAEREQLTRRGRS